MIVSIVSYMVLLERSYERKRIASLTIVKNSSYSAMLSLTYFAVSISSFTLFASLTIN